MLLGSETPLVEMDRATDALAQLASATPGVREALRSGVRSLSALELTDGGPEFVAAVKRGIPGEVGSGDSESLA